jgi:hypothetical protein
MNSQPHSTLYYIFRWEPLTRSDAAHVSGDFPFLLFFSFLAVSNLVVVCMCPETLSLFLFLAEFVFSLGKCVERGRFQITPLYYTENYIRLYGYYSTGVLTTTQVCMCVRTTAERAPTSRCKRPGCYSNLFGDGEFEHHSYCCLLCWRVEWDRDICCVGYGAALHHHPPRSTPRAAFECFENGD